MRTQYFHTIDESYQVLLENIDTKTQQKGRGRGSRSRGKTRIARGSEKEEEFTSGQSGRGGNNIGRG